MMLLSYYLGVLIEGAGGGNGKKIPASNERHSSGDTRTIFVYTNVTGSNQNGSSGDRPPRTIILYMHTSGVTVCVRSMLGPWHSRDSRHYLCIVQEYPEYYNKTCTSLSTTPTIIIARAYNCYYFVLVYSQRVVGGGHKQYTCTPNL